MVKSVEKAVKEVVEGMEQNLHITFTPDIWENAMAAMDRRGMVYRENFDGPIFENISGYSVNGDWVAVMTKKGETYVYPASSVARIKHFNKE